MADLFSTDVLTRVVQSLFQPSSFLLDRFFSATQTEQSDEIHFDVDNKARRIAPFVSPLVAGKLVASRGFQTKTFKPAYVKDKRVFDANRPMKRAMGEQIGGSSDPATRLRILLATELQEQVEMVQRRLEVMAGQALTTGKVTVTGEQYPTVVVDFLRDTSLTIVLTGAARWGQSGIKPLDLLQDWALSVLQLSGAQPMDVVMTVDAWKVFRSDADVKVQLDRFRGNSTMVTDAALQDGATFMGNIEGFNIWVYAGWYVDDQSGTLTPILPAGTVLMGSAQIEGVRAFGAIRDEEAGYQALPYWAKSWVEKDPAVRYLMLQSAPLVVPYRVNASFAATVL
jgi:hypothetical protein